MNQVELQRVMWVMGRGILVHSLGSMNLSPMILDDSFKPSKKVVKQ